MEETNGSNLFDKINNTKRSRVVVKSEDINDQYAIDNKKYTDRVVAWIDILGIKKRMENEESPDEVLSIMGKLREYATSEEKVIGDDKVRITQIADGVFFTGPKNTAGKIFVALARIHWKVLCNTGMMIRGAVTLGGSYEEETDFLIGPAYVEVYTLEGKIAIFPRIVVSEKLVGYCKDNNLDVSCISKDFDKIEYIDVCKYVISESSEMKEYLFRMFFKHNVMKTLDKEHKNLLGGDKKEDSDHKKKKKDIYNAQKVGWLISKLRENNLEAYCDE